MKTRTIYNIFVRPPESHIWTQHMKKKPGGKSIPWRSFDAEEANREAVRLVHAESYCSRVVTVKLPHEPDEQLFAVLADGETMYRAMT